MSTPLIVETMGTVASITTAAALTEAQVAQIEATLERWEDRFSLWRPTSELSRLNAGELTLDRCSNELAQTYGAALAWQGRTVGAFTAHRPGGGLDLNGIVKARAIAEVGRVLDAAGHDDWCVNIGGDVLVRGRDPQTRGPWRVGIVDPRDRTQLLTVAELSATRRAVATSGTAERGDHIWGAGDDLAQVSVVADDIETADVLATALVAAGSAEFARLTAVASIEVVAVGVRGELWATDAFGVAAQ